jgi:hypothetical protein
MKRLVLDDGSEVEDEGEILAAVTNFYKELLFPMHIKIWMLS